MTKNKKQGSEICNLVEMKMRTNPLKKTLTDSFLGGIVLEGGRLQSNGGFDVPRCCMHPPVYPDTLPSYPLYRLPSTISPLYHHSHSLTHIILATHTTSVVAMNSEYQTMSGQFYISILEFCFTNLIPA